MRAIALAALAALSLAACSDADRAEMKEDVKAVATDVKTDLKETADSAAVANLKADVKDVAQDTGAVLKTGATELKEGVQDTAALARAKIAEERAKSTITTTTVAPGGETTTTVERK